MKELLEFKNKIKDMSLEQLLVELQKLIEGKEYHRYVSHNDKLEKVAKDMILLVKLQIMEVNI